LSRYDDIVKALTELKGEAKLEDIHKKILDNVPINSPSKGTIGGTLFNYKEPKEGRRYSFQPLGKGVWKLVDNEVKPKVNVRKKSKTAKSAPIVGQRTTVAAEDLQSFIDQIIEPLKKDGGEMSITVEVIYRPKLSE
jgi:hypothetical protein